MNEVRVLPEEHRMLRLAWWVGLVGFSTLMGWRLARIWFSSELSLATQTPDDAFYYFEVARNIISGRGSTFDGINATNGYHPLWMMVCVLLTGAGKAVAGLDGSLHLAPRIILTFQWALGIVAVPLLARGARSTFGPGIAPALILAGACNPWTIYAFTDGMESGLAFVVVSLLIVLVPRIRPFTAPPGVADLGFGLLLGAAFLSRLDLFLVPVALAAWVLVAWATGRGPGAAGRSLRWVAAKAIRWALPVGLLVSGYILFNDLHFDSVIPISGKLKSSFPDPGFHARWLVEQTVPMAAGTLSVIAALMLTRASGVSADRRVWFGVGSLFIVLHAADTLVFTHWGVFKWHFSAYWPFALFNIAGVIALALARVSPAGAARLTLGGVALLVALGGAGQVAFFRERESRVFQAQSYRAATTIRELVREDQAIGMTDCGVLGYYRGGRVVNLDGVVNDLGYQVALRDGRFDDYLRRESIGYIAVHAVAVDKVRPGYSAYPYTAPCHLYGGESAPVLLREEDEVYRGASFDEGRGPEVFMIWRTGL